MILFGESKKSQMYKNNPGGSPGLGYRGNKERCCLRYKLAINIGVTSGGQMHSKVIIDNITINSKIVKSLYVHFSHHK